MKKSLILIPVLLLCCASNCKKEDLPNGEDVFKIPEQQAEFDKTIPAKLAEYSFVTSITDSITTIPTKGVRQSIVKFTTNVTNPLILCAFEVNLKEPTISLEVTYPDDRGASWQVQNMVKQAQKIDREGHKVIGAVNADFFDMGGTGYPLGAVYSNGQAIKTSLCYDQNATYFCQYKSGLVDLGGRANYTKIDFDDVKEFVGGLYPLAHNGEPVVYDATKAPRTAVGLSKDMKTLYLVIVDELVPAKPRDGISLTDLATLMIQIGSFDSINFDGGGSSTFVVRDGDGFATPNKQPGAYLRPVANGLAIIKN